jgi:UDP-N-acetylmuramoyl-tripeptide--D-alanyl-D-alanine ligase
MASRTQARTLLVGRGETAEVRATDVVLDADGRASFVLHAPDGPAEGLPVSLQLVGEHHVGNALAVAATAHEWGMPWPDVAQALSAATARSRWRMEVTTRPDGVTVVNDAYNANPESMRAALRALAAMRRPQGRTVAVVGGMLELGPDSDAEHAGVGRLAAELGVDELVAVGDLAGPAATAYAEAGGAGTTTVADRDEAHRLLEQMLRPGDVVLLKSSRDSGLRFLGDDLAGTGDAATEGGAA